MAERIRNTRKIRRTSARSRLESAAGRVDAIALAKGTMRDAVRRLHTEGGMSREEMIAAIGDIVDEWITHACEKRSKSRIIRHCGDRIGDVAEWVAEDRIEELLN